MSREGKQELGLSTIEVWVRSLYKKLWVQLYSTRGDALAGLPVLVTCTAVLCWVQPNRHQTSSRTPTRKKPARRNNFRGLSTPRKYPKIQRSKDPKIRATQDRSPMPALHGT